MFRIEYDQIARHLPMPFFCQRQPRFSRQSFMDSHHLRQNFNPRHPRHPGQNFMDQRYPRHPRQNLTYATHEPTLLMPPTLFSRFPRVSYLMFSVQTLEDARFKIKMREMHHKESFCRQKYRFHSRSKEKPNAIHFNNDFFLNF